METRALAITPHRQFGPGAGFEPCSPRSQRGALTGYATTRSPGALGWIRTSDPGGRSSLLFSAELRAHFYGAPGGTRTHIFLSITFVSVRSGGGYWRILVWDLKAPSRLNGPWGENSHSHSAKAGGLQPLGLTRVQPTDIRRQQSDFYRSDRRSSRIACDPVASCHTDVIWSG